MPYGKVLDLEIVAHGSEVLQILPIAAHVHKYTENFVYTDKIPDESTPIAYYESEPLDSWKNIQLVDQTHVIPINSLGVVDDNLTWMKVSSSSFVTPYKKVAITNMLIVDEWGKEKPLFFKHILPENTVEAHVSVIQNGNKHDIETGMRIDISRGAIWTNYQNYYNPDNGDYKLYFVSTVSVDPDDETNVSTEQALLNPVPAIKQATWQDIDQETGNIIATAYTMEEVSGGWHYTIAAPEPSSIPGVEFMSLAAQHCDDGFASAHDNTDPPTGIFYVKPLEEGLIKLKLPAGRTPEDPWSIRITNGAFWQLLLGTMRKYYIPEWHYQPFSPAKPYIYSPYRKMMWVNRRHLAATRKMLAIDPNEARHITIYAYDRDGVLKLVWTSDGSLAGKRYSNTDVFYDNQVLSWDNRNGVVSLAQDTDPNYTYYASFFYEAEDMEYTSLTLNPLQYPAALTNMWVFYCIPDVHKYDQAIHVLGVDAHGKIVYTSQGEGRMYPNLKLLNDDGSFNPDTIIGKKYSSLIEPDNFKNAFCVPYVNSHQYYILGEALVMDIGDEYDSIVFDVRRDGATIKEGFRLEEEQISYFEDAIRANPKILQSVLGYDKDGQNVPNNNIMVVKAPITLLEEYGGELSEGAAKALLNKYLPAADTSVVKWEYPWPTLDGWSPEPGVVDLEMSWEGPNLQYNIYRTINPIGEWTQIYALQTGEEPQEMFFRDIGENLEGTSLPPGDEDEQEEEVGDIPGLSEGVVYYYRVRVEEMKDPQIPEIQLEYPPGYTLAVMVRPDTGTQADFLTINNPVGVAEI